MSGIGDSIETDLVGELVELWDYIRDRKPDVNLAPGNQNGWGTTTRNKRSAFPKG